MYLQIECIDEVETNLLESMLDFIFKKCSAIAMINQIEHLIMEQCQGCAISHPSQNEHSCITQTVTKDARSMYWGSAMDRVCHGGIVFDFLTRCEAENLPLNGYLTGEALNKMGGEWNEDIIVLTEIMAARRFL